jgi:hypothetical protein
VTKTFTKKLQLLLCCIVIGTSCFTQTVNDRIYIKTGEDILQNFMLAIYLYPSFKEGLVEFKNGTRFTRPMNYNRIAGTIEFMEKKDTMSFADESAVSQVNIGGDIFVYTPICLRLLSAKKAKLYIYEKMKLGDKQKIGAMGIRNSGSAIETVEKINSYDRTYNIDVNETVIISRSVSYFIQTGTSEIMLASRKNVLNLFRQHEDVVKNFIKSKNTSFNKEKDLVELANFLDEL